MKKEHMWFFIIAFISMIWYLSIEYLGHINKYSVIVILLAIPWVVIYLLIFVIYKQQINKERNR